MIHAPYRGSAPAVTDLVGGQIPLMFDPVQSVLSHVQSGRLRDFEAEAWWGVFAPARLPAAEAALLRREVERVTRSAAFQEKLGNLGVTPAAPIRDSDAFLNAEVDKWGKAVRESGATAE